MAPCQHFQSEGSNKAGREDEVYAHTFVVLGSIVEQMAEGQLLNNLGQCV